MLAFYVDHQFRAAVVHGLRARGIDVLTAFEDGADRLDDELLLIRATELDRVLVTHDKGFLGRAAEWQRSSREFPGVVFEAQSPIDIGKAVEYLELIANAMSADEMRNRVEYIPART
jgi:hypothetical protein